MVKSPDWKRFGLATDEHQTDTASTNEEFGNESGFLPQHENELFAGVETHEPWWRSQFFISEPVLFGMWDGVFTSCLINIFGVIVFLRAGWIVGQAGVIGSVGIVLATVGIALISVLSAIGICERCRMESGGVYFLLAHVLGSRRAAAVGILYVFGQAVGCALGLLGFAESLAVLIGLNSNKIAEKSIAAITVFLLWSINLVGVKVVIKLQFLLLLVMLLAALDFAVGCFTHTNYSNGFNGWFEGDFTANLLSQYINGYDWFSVFGVFFPTVTGVMAGINMSGDLRQPSKDIPNGTLSALATAAGIYLIFILFLGSTCTRQALVSDFDIVSKVSAVKLLLLAGLYVSSLSSCLGTMYGVPRVLQSIANEHVIPIINVLGYGKGPNKVPIFATAVVAAIVITFTMFGDINKLATIITMPFLITYAALDYAYFALAQTYDIQYDRERRLHNTMAKSTNKEVSDYNRDGRSDLDNLFPEHRSHHFLTSNVQNVQSGLRVHEKTSNWYSSLCNRWLSLFGAILNIGLMFVVDSTYAVIHLIILFLIWMYIRLAKPAVKPGAASDFKLFNFFNKNLRHLCGKNRQDYEEIIVTPLHAPVETQTSQLTEDNDDFASRKRFHQVTPMDPFEGTIT